MVHMVLIHRGVLVPVGEDFFDDNCYTNLTYRLFHEGAGYWYSFILKTIKGWWFHFATMLDLILSPKVSFFLIH